MNKQKGAHLMAFKSLQELEQGITASGQTWSEADKALAKKNLNYGNSIYALKNDWINASKRGDKKAAQRAHDQTETLRRQYGGYSGGTDGSEYIRDNTYFTFDDPYEDTLRGLAEKMTSQEKFSSPYQDTLNQLADSILSYGTFSNPYQKQMEQVLSSYLNRDPFSYNPDSDPVWQQYQKTYLREGQRAREDAIGSYAAATGGQTSTAAMQAASQAQDYYNAKMADQLPALYGQAYNRWMDEGEQYSDQLDTLRGLNSDALSAWNANRNLLNNQMDTFRSLSSDALSEWNANRALTKDQLSAVQSLSDSLYDRDYDKWKSDYQLRRDEISDARYADELAYDRAEDASNRAWKEKQAALSQALTWMKMGLSPDDAVLAASGLSDADVSNYIGTVQAQQAAKGSRRSSGGSRSSSSKSSGSSSSGQADYEGLFRDAYNSGHPENYIASHYKEYGFSKSTGLSKEYKEAYNEDFEDLLSETRDMVDASEYSPSAAASYLRAKGYDDETISRLTGALWKR